MFTALEEMDNNLSSRLQLELQMSIDLFLSSGNRTERSPIRFVIIRMIYKIGRFRRKALRDIAMTLEILLSEARALEISEMQANDIESSGNADAVLSQPTQKSRAKGNCYNCNES